MNPNSDRLRAEFMDAVYRAADRRDVDYYVDRARSVEGPALELGCGGGRIYLELLEAGVDADGIDRSAEALALLREHAADRGLEPTVRRADMTDYSADRAYGLVCCPFNAVQELTTIDSQQALLKSAYDLLAPGGTFVFDTFVPDLEYIAETWGEWQRRTIEFRGEPVEYHTRSRLVDSVTQEYVSEKKATTQDGEQLFSFEGRATLLPYRELELLVRSSPFESWTVAGDYTDEPLNDGHSAQVWALERTET
ncbi:class I SAM-dependent methyltransferase [Halopiger goleimassiliensis]|uniref:class I SAM-dependent methyltransferase n=1 Tax=Halopiger goleimassiliensis TaxID=1293048 RepID=UPI000677FA82|nr:class I SAM-dependent methyltransferase [Halopiger goleimassiliensis]